MSERRDAARRRDSHGLNVKGEAICCASNAAVSHLTECRAVEWGQYGINVNAVAPHFIRTPGTASASQWTWLERWSTWPPLPPRS